MSAQKNTLFNYFGKSPAAKPSPNASSPARATLTGTPKTSKVTDSPSGTPKRGPGHGARGGAEDSPKSTKSVVREQWMAASPRTRVQKRLLNAAASSPSTYEPHFLRNVLSPQNKKQGQFSTPQKNKENATRALLSPVLKALQEHEESTSSLASEENSVESADVNVAVSPVKCSLRTSPRKPVRNLNKDFFNSPTKRVGEVTPHGKEVKGPEEISENTSEADVDVFSLFGQYIASEMRRLNSDKAVRSLKLKIMKSIVEVQSELEAEGSM